MANTLSAAAQALYDTLVTDSQAAATTDAAAQTEQGNMVTLQQAVIAAQNAVNAEQQKVNDAATAAQTAHQKVAQDAIALVQQLSTEYGFPLPPDFGGVITPPAPPSPPASS